MMNHHRSNGTGSVASRYLEALSTSYTSFEKETGSIGRFDNHFSDDNQDDDVVNNFMPLDLGSYGNDVIVDPDSIPNDNDNKKASIKTSRQVLTNFPQTSSTYSPPYRSEIPRFHEPSNDRNWDISSAITMSTTSTRSTAMNNNFGIKVSKDKTRVVYDFVENNRNMQNITNPPSLPDERSAYTDHSETYPSDFPPSQKIGNVRDRIKLLQQQDQNSVAVATKQTDSNTLPNKNKTFSPSLEGLNDQGNGEISNETHTPCLSETEGKVNVSADNSKMKEMVPTPTNPSQFWRRRESHVAAGKPTQVKQSVSNSSHLEGKKVEDIDQVKHDNILSSHSMPNSTNRFRSSLNLNQRQQESDATSTPTQLKHSVSKTSNLERKKVEDIYNSKNDNILPSYLTTDLMNRLKASFNSNQQKVLLDIFSSMEQHFMKQATLSKSKVQNTVSHGGAEPTNTNDDMTTRGFKSLNKSVNQYRF